MKSLMTIILILMVYTFNVYSDDVGFLEQAERTEGNMPVWYTDTSLVDTWGMNSTKEFVSLYSSASNKDATAYKIGASMYLASRLNEKDNVLEVYSKFEKYYSEYHEIIYGDTIPPEKVNSKIITTEFEGVRIKERALDLIEEYRLLYD